MSPRKASTRVRISTSREMSKGPIETLNPALNWSEPRGHECRRRARTRARVVDDPEEPVSTQPPGHLATRRKQNPQPKKLHLRSSQAKPNQNPQHKPQRGLPKSIPTRPTTTRRTNLQNVFRLHRQPNPGRNHKTNLKLRGLQTLLHAKTQNPHPSRPIDTPGFESYRVFIPAPALLDGLSYL